WPQAAILGVSRAAYRPVHFRTALRPRLILPLALSYDHRIIDGADAVRFMRYLVEALEHPLLMSFEE
ncbi:MAG: 2-oxo acid dehydrogenase subunit E2, partial [Planctomycetota bacterium]